MVASIIVQFAPMALAVWMLDRRDGGRKRVLLKHGGVALIASGVCAYFGAKYFGLAVFGRHAGFSYGDKAADGALFCAGVGAAMLILHAFLCALFPNFMHVAEGRKKARR